MDTVELCANEIKHHVDEASKLMDCMRILNDTLQGMIEDTTATGLEVLLERAQDHLHEVRKTVDALWNAQAKQTGGI